MINYLELSTEVRETLDKSFNKNGWKMLNRLEYGSSSTPRSWFYEDRDPQWILDSVLSMVKTDSKDLKFIADYDASRASKFLPQGGAAPFTERQVKFAEYFDNLDSPTGLTGSVLWKKAKKNVIRRLGFNESGVPLALKQVVERGISEDKYNTNSGWPLYRKRKSPEAIQEALDDAEAATSKRYPFTLGTRATMGKTGKDARFIFMAPMAVNIQGQRFVQPLMDYLRLKRFEFFAPWEGYKEVQRVQSSFNDGELRVGADYRGMDMHFNRFHGEEVFDVVKHFFKKQYWPMLHDSVQYPFLAPVLTSLGMVNQEHALASGSEWTNFLETMWNYIWVEYLTLKYHFKVSHAMGIGDDQLWVLQNLSDKDIPWLTSTLVQEMELAKLPGNAEKQELSTHHCVFLQRASDEKYAGPDHNLPNAGVYPLVRNVTSQVYPERYHNEKAYDSDAFVLRVLMIAENSCNHYAREKYAEFVAKSNKNIPEFFARYSPSQADRLYQEKRRSISGFIPTYNQEKVEGKLSDFVMYRLIGDVCQRLKAQPKE